MDPKYGLMFFTKEDMPVTHIRWNSSNLFYAGNAEGHLCQFDISKSKKKFKKSNFFQKTKNSQKIDKEVWSTLEEENQILAMDYTSEERKLCTAGKDCGIRVYDDKTKKIVRHYEKGDWYAPGHSNRIFAVKFKNDDQNVIVSGGWDSSIFIWDIRQRKHVDAFCGPNISGDTIDTKADSLLIGSHRSKDPLELWDFKERKKICSVDWMPDEKVNAK